MKPSCMHTVTTNTSNATQALTTAAAAPTTIASARRTAKHSRGTKNHTPRPAPAIKPKTASKIMKTPQDWTAVIVPRDRKKGLMKSCRFCGFVENAFRAERATLQAPEEEVLLRQSQRVGETLMLPPIREQ